jgi:cAMP-dependent protein kinase regulator
VNNQGLAGWLAGWLAGCPTPCLHCSVIRKGDDPDGFYILFKGGAKVLHPEDESKVIVTLKPPESFGEVALFSSAKRSASIVAAEAGSQFLRIATRPFLKIMQGKNKEEASLKKKLLRSMPLFSGRTEEQIHNTALFMFARRYAAGVVIAREGEPCDALYLRPATPARSPAYLPLAG